MSILKTTIFCRHIALFFLLAYPCGATNFSYIDTPPNSTGLLVKSMSHKSDNRSSSSEPFIIEKNTYNNHSNINYSNPITSHLLLSSKKSDHHQLYDASLHSFQNFDSLSMNVSGFFDNTSICEAAPSVLREPSTSANAVISSFNQMSQNDIFSQNVDCISLRVPSPFPKDVGAVGWLSNLPPLPVVDNANQEKPEWVDNTAQQNNVVNKNAPINQITANPSIEKKKQKKVKKKTKKEKKFACQYCGNLFTRDNNRKAHERNKHINPGIFECKECGKKLSSKQALKQHTKLHNGDLHWCKQCNRGYTTLNYLKRHQRIHTGEKPFRCKECNKQFSFQTGLKVHEKKHTQQKNYLSRFRNTILNQK